MSEAALETSLRTTGGVAKTRLLWLGMFVALVLGSGGATWWFLGRPKPTQDLLLQGLSALDAGDLPKARACLRELKQSPDNASRAKLLRAALLVRQGYAVPALSELDGLANEPDHKFQSLLLRGEAWHRLGRHLEAQTALLEALKLDDDAVNAHRWLGASYYDLGAIHQAVHHLQRTVELDPTDQRPLRLLGLIHKDYERFEEAEGFYARSLRLKEDQPDWEQVRLEMASCQVKLRRHREALETLRPCPKSAAVLVLEAECRYALGEVMEATEALQQALALEPKHLEGLVLQGTILLEDGKPAEAIETLKQATQAAPQDYTAHFKLALAYTQAGKTELAAAEQKTADHIRDVRKVFAELHEAAWNNPEDIRIRIRLAQLAKELGRPDLEAVWLKAASALAPSIEPEEARP